MSQNPRPPPAKDLPYRLGCRNKLHAPTSSRRRRIRLGTLHSRRMGYPRQKRRAGSAVFPEYLSKVVASIHSSNRGGHIRHERFRALDGFAQGVIPG